MRYWVWLVFRAVFSRTRSGGGGEVFFIVTGYRLPRRGNRFAGEPRARGILGGFLGKAFVNALRDECFVRAHQRNGAENCFRRLAETESTARGDRCRVEPFRTSGNVKRPNTNGLHGARRVRGALAVRYRAGRTSRVVSTVAEKNFC